MVSNHATPEEKKFVVDAIVEAQKEHLAEKGYLMTNAEAAKMFKTTGDWIVKYVPAGFRNSSHLSPKQTVETARRLKAIKELQEEETADGGRPLSWTELGAKLGVPESWIHRHAKELPSGLRGAQPESLRRISGEVPVEVARAAEQISDAVAMTPLGKNSPDPKVTARMLMAMLSKATADGVLFCPRHPHARLVWSCGDSLGAS